MIVLGIETSCDETAAAVVRGDGTILSNLVLSQLDDHRPYGGVVPEIAARAHLQLLDSLVARAVREAGTGFAVDAVAATAGPGLIGGVMVGVMTAKAIAVARGLPFLAVNHLEGHALTVRLTGEVAFPYLLLLISGGHSQLLAVEGVGRYVSYGATVDDALGEAFDKTARLLGLAWPGGPEVERAALGGDPARFPLPRPMLGRPGCDFSFSGLKTAVRLLVARAPLRDADRRDLCASFQAAIADVLEDRCRAAIRRFRAAYSVTGPGLLVAAGGVAANRVLRARLRALCAAEDMALAAPPPLLCTDNAAMIAWAGLERLQSSPGCGDGLEFAPRPRWPLDSLRPPARGEHGVEPGAGV